MPRGWRRCGVILAVLVSLAGAAVAAELDVRLFLIGDAGSPDPRGEPALIELARQASRDPERSMIVFLGDNIYPRGLPAEGHPGRKEAERRINAQLEVMYSSGARGVFVPGNHDWDRHTAEGWNAVRREGLYVEERGRGRVSFLPRGGCPGPVVEDIGKNLRLVALDSHWWIHAHLKPVGADSPCPERTEDDVIASLKTAVSGPGDRHVVVMAHHPMVTGGSHGGHFTLRHHVFPLRAYKKWMWLPLPGIGSLYPYGRSSGWFSQDVSGGRYQVFLNALEKALAERPPLVFAAGHDHGLQILSGRLARHLVVSGAGSSHHNSRPQWIQEATRFASGLAGFVTLDFLDDGTVNLVVTTLPPGGKGQKAFEEAIR